MAYPKNDALRKFIIDHASAFTPLRTVGDPSVAKMVAAELKKEFPGRSDSSLYQITCYYLRGGNKKTKSDSRRTYTARELAHIDLMSAKERAAYATASGRTLRAVDAALSRYRKGMSEYANSAPFSGSMALADIQKQGYINFSNTSHLSIYGFTREAVVAARAFLAHPYGISLRAPNILYHAVTKRRYAMSGSEQQMLLTNPKNFLRERADKVKAGWVCANVDPVADDLFDSALDEMPSTRAYERRKTGKTVHSLAERLTSILQAPGLVIAKNTVEYTSLDALRVWVNCALGNAAPGFNLSDPSTYIDDTKPALCAEDKHLRMVKPRIESGPLNPDKPFNPSDPSTYIDDTVKIKALQPDDDEDAWMSDFKPIGV